MAKYSTGRGGGRGNGGSCELCGKSTDDLQTATVAGAELQVCSDCAPHGESDGQRGGESNRSASSDRRRRAAQNVARAADRRRGDAEYWVEHGTNYERDRLPYLVSDYEGIASRAREEAGLSPAELADELDVDEADLLAVEEGRAAQAGVGGSVIRALEERLDVTLAEE